MSEYDASRIWKADYFRINHLRTGAPKKPAYVIGFDSEAENGYPFIYQFGHPDGHVDIINIPKRGRYVTLFKFIDYLFANCKRKDVEYIVFGFNLQYEYTQLFRALRDDIKLAPDFQLGTDEEQSSTGQCDFTLRAYNNKRYSFTIEFGKTHRRIRVLDAMAFFPMSLDAASLAVGAGRKLKAPKRFTRADAAKPDFVAYAEQDARLTQSLGQYIVDLHRRYDVPMTMTAPHFASRVFRHNYLMTEIPLAHPDLEQLGLNAYHGGKNGFYLDGPTYLSDVYHVDIRSAYPEAMRQLPDLEKSEWIYAEKYTPGVHAIWQITGIYVCCRYRCLMDNSKWCESGYVEATVTSYELDSVVQRGEFIITSCVGYILEGPSGGALVRYVDDFYSMKRNGSTPAEVAAAKLFLNSLYGKFFQKVPVGIVGTYNMETEEYITTDPTQDFDHMAGGLYHPPIAALITGFVRAKIHGLEHDYESVMTSTDGFFALKPPPDHMIGKELGQLSAEKGTLHIWRERLYVFSHIDKGEKKVIAALHGWHGTVKQLLRVPLIAGTKYHYTTTVMITLKMSTKRIGNRLHQPGMFSKQKRVLDLSVKEVWK